MGRWLQGVVVACALLCASPAIAGAQATYVRTIPTAGLQFDVDWTNHDIYTGDGATMRRYDLASGGLEATWFAPSGAIINDVAAVTGGVDVAAAGTRRLYGFNSDGTTMVQTDNNTMNRIGDVRGLLVANTGAYLVGNGTLLRISHNPFGYPQLVGAWGLSTHADTGWETCSPSDPPACLGSSNGDGTKAGQIYDARDLDIRENVENTGSFAIFVLERRPLPGGYDYRVSVFSDEGVPASFAPQGFVLGGSSVSNQGSGANQLSDPYGIALDVDRGRMYIADQGNHRVDVYTFGGQFLQAFGWGVDTGTNQLESCTFQSGCQAGLPVAQLNNPLRVQVDPSNGDVYVAHLGGISQFSFAGTGGGDPGGGGGSPIKAPKDVLLKAKPKEVEKNAKTTLTASLLPCLGTRGEPIVFEKKTGDKWKRVGGQDADSNCRGKVSPKVKEPTQFRARSPETNNFYAGTSSTVKVKVQD
ncbi:MAG: hypothetical protein QOI10_3335 [Solirubrobacterales bacterium]|jgi:hypothetical protein|nr:hypothetical protein [Solirubrobacterales bacterium]